MMLRTITIALVCVALSGCGAGMARLGTYGTRMADAKTEVDGREYSIWLHPTENTVAAQRGFGALVAQRAVEGITLGSASFQEPLPIWRRALEWLLLPAGCSIVSIYELERSSYEAAYQCPAGVDLRALVREHRDTLRDGQPLPAQ